MTASRPARNSNRNRATDRVIHAEIVEQTRSPIRGHELVAFMQAANRSGYWRTTLWLLLSTAMPSRLFGSVVLTVLAIAFATVGLFAQGTSVLRGRVTDPQAAVVAGAAVTVTIEATGAKRTTTSDGEGGFVVAELPPGLVSVEVVANGFAPQLFEHVSVAVGQTRDLEVALAVAGVKEVITIDATDSMNHVDTATSSVDAVIGQREIATLPLNGRNFLELALLVPGNTAAPNFDPTKTNSVLISSAGQLGRGSATTIDGADNNDDVVGGCLWTRCRNSRWPRHAIPPSWGARPRRRSMW
jgi:hypothetical protein